MNRILYRLTKPGIGIRLTFYFVIFGIIIGYISFLLFTVISTHTYINIATDAFKSMTREMTGSDDANFVPRIINKKNEELAASIRMVDRIISKTGTKISFKFYNFDETKRSWSRVYLTGDNYFRLEDVPARTVRELNKTVIAGIKKSSDFYYGKSDTVSMMVLLSPEDSRTRHVFSFDASREGIDSFMRRNRDYMLMFAVSLFIVSALLGKFFAIRIARPIKKLSAEASMAAAGNLDIRFSVKRRDEIGALSNSLNIMSDRIRGHVNEIERRMNAMETMNMIDKAVLSSISRNDLLDRVVGIVSSLFKSSSIAMAIHNEEKRGFDILSFYQGGGRGVLKQDPFIPDHIIGREFLPRAENVLQMAIKDTEHAPPFTRAFLEISNGTLINVPIFISDRYLGSLVLTKPGLDPFPEHDVTTIRMIADQVGIALQSVRSFEEKEKILVGILLALTKSIDAKSKWTAGHSERVAHLSEELGLRCNLDEAGIRTLTFSAILHDIGKIAVPEYILDKPARLSPDEYEVVKQHPSVGAEIIYDIPSYESIVPGILYHHEHWDGGGYPLGLRGREIPLNSRIITIADVFDAITADRPYRSGMSRNDAYNFIRENKGTLFDPDLAGEFIDLLVEEEAGQRD